MVLHTPEGAIVYTNDYKLDNTPVMGLKPNYDALNRIAKEGVKALIIDSLYSGDERKTPSEKIARDLLEETMLTVNNKNNGILVTTFSSHIARLKSVVEFSKKLDREVIFIGRSLKKYVQASVNAGICPFEKDIRIGSFKKQVDSFLRKANKNKDKFVVVCTGHQGEPGSVLDRISRKTLPYDLNKDDNVIFSSKTIPAPINIANKSQLDKRLKKERVRIFDNVHVSGHGGREDARDLIQMLNPEHIIPSHGEMQKLTPMMELAKELGYKVGKTCHLMENGRKLKL
jgi:ribonuclease J